ncbi:MAG: hypothetical protein DMF65_09890 [Acidobacteria bacterium]|nr:MAG: hypothetical protein DMF65_09890 [Acidobacteriota bacterium]
MAYVPDFAHDVFISYAHVNNIPRRDGESGWVTSFRDALARQLPGFLGRDDGLDLWMDKRKIDGGDLYDDVIDRALRGSAVMISVMSKGYFASTYCVRELKTFCDHGDIAVEFETGKKSRVVKVIISPDFPEELQDPRIRRTDGYRFYAEDGDGKKRRFMWTPEGVTDNGYWGAVERLAQEVAEVLTRMAGRRPPCPVPPTGQAIYLAEVTDDLEDVRSQIKSALTQQGIQVLPELRLPSQSGALKDEIAKSLERSVLSVHLVGQWPGKAADGDPLPATQIQYRLASEIGARNKLRRIVWLPPDLDMAAVRSDAHRAFLESLRYEQESESPMEMLQKSVEELKETILKKLLPPPEKIDKFKIKRHALVYVAHHPEDGEEAETIKKYLRDARQDVMLTRGKDEREQMKDLRARMKSCDAVLILYGRSPVKWARDFTQEARDMAEKRRRNPLFAKSVCDGPPDPKEDLGLDFEGWPILPCRRGIGVEGLEPFIKAIAAEG